MYGNRESHSKTNLETIGIGGGPLLTSKGRSMGRRAHASCIFCNLHFFFDFYTFLSSKSSKSSLRRREVLRASLPVCFGCEIVRKERRILTCFMFDSQLALSLTSRKLSGQKGEIEFLWLISRSVEHKIVRMKLLNRRSFECLSSWCPLDAN